jgi:low temperature requirement protein LtrA
VLNAAHFAERHGLMILIVLGESLISVGLAVEHHDHVDSSLLYGALAGLAVTSAMWWAYFVGEDDRAAEAFAASPPRARVDQGLIGYGLAHLVMIYGLVAVAAGTKLSVNDLTARASLAGSWLIAGGAATFLLGGALFRVALRFASPWARVLGAALCLTAVVAGTRGSTATELVVLAVYIATTLFAEYVLRGRAVLRESIP